MSAHHEQPADGESEPHTRVAVESGRVPRNHDAHQQAASESGGAPAHDAPPPPSHEPWWHSKALVSVLALVGASIAPVTTLVSSGQQRAIEGERAAHAARLQEQQQEHAVRIEFFEKVVSPSISMTPDSRLAALRYFKGVLPQGDLRTWAELEYADLAQLIAAQRTADELQAQKDSEAKAATQKVQDALGELVATPELDEARRQELTAALDAQARDARQRAETAAQAKQAAAELERKLKQKMPTPVRGAPLAEAAASVPVAMSAAPATAAPSQALAAQINAPASAPEPPLAIDFSARQDFLAETESEKFYRFAVALDATPAVLARVASVAYTFDHPSFRQKLLSSSDRAKRFEVSYRGWGCLSEVRAKITLIDGKVLERGFDQCATIR
jgi:hypothetical protein